MVSFILPGNSASGGYEVANSVRFDAGSDSNFQRSMVTGTSRRKFTVSVWFKLTRPSPGGEEFIFHSWQNADNRFMIALQSDNVLQIRNRAGGSDNVNYTTNQVFRDFSSWYHMVVQVDTTHANTDFRIRLYINGSQVTSWSTSNTPSQNTDMSLGTSDFTNIIGKYGGGGNNFDGYMTEYVYLDGLDHAASFFGEFDDDTGIWKPKEIDDFTFGNNGFYLDFEDSSSLGKDVSGESHNFTANNFSTTNPMTDTCTNNFATMNPLDNYYAGSTFSEGNLTLVTSAANYASNTSTFGVNNGKWYCEIKAKQIYNGYAQFGIRGRVATSTTDKASAGTDGYIYTAAGGQKVNNASGSSYGTVWNNNDIIGIALDLDNNYLYFSRNGTWQNSGDPESGSSGTGAAFNLGAPSSGFYYIACSDNDSASGSANTYEFNFGNPTYGISSGNSDANGYGNFEYAVPSGYYSLCTKNLADYG